MYWGMVKDINKLPMLSKRVQTICQGDNRYKPKDWKIETNCKGII